MVQLPVLDQFVLHLLPLWTEEPVVQVNYGLSNHVIPEKVIVLGAGLAGCSSQSPARERRSWSVLKSIGKNLVNIPRVTLRDETTQEGAVSKPSSKELPAGDADSRYQLHGEIARGGMGAIIKGRDADLGRDLAIKVLLDNHKLKLS